MARAAAASVRPNVEKARDHLIVALDVPTLPQARSLVEHLGDEISFYKVGWHLFAKGLADFIDYLVQKEKKVFLDFKSIDITETMRGMISSVSRMGVEFVTVMGTQATIRAAKDGRQGKQRPKILVVTLLTDHSEEEMRKEYNTQKTIEEFVAERAAIASLAGADGVIASAREVAAIREAVLRPDFLIVTPGIRPAGSDSDDQKRTATPAAAISAGADYLVIGRPILRAPDKLEAACKILEEMQAALDQRA